MVKHESVHRLLIHFRLGCAGLHLEFWNYIFVISPETNLYASVTSHLIQCGRLNQRPAWKSELSTILRTRSTLLGGNTAYRLVGNISGQVLWDAFRKNVSGIVMRSICSLIGHETSLELADYKAGFSKKSLSLSDIFACFEMLQSHQEINMTKCCAPTEIGHFFPLNGQLAWIMTQSSKEAYTRAHNAKWRVGLWSKQKPCSSPSPPSPCLFQICKLIEPRANWMPKL